MAHSHLDFAFRVSPKALKYIVPTIHYVGRGYSLSLLWKETTVLLEYFLEENKNERGSEFRAHTDHCHCGTM